MRKRFKQVLQYGWAHAHQIAIEEQFSFSKKIFIFIDILSCFYKYKMWSNQYVQERFWEKTSEERGAIGTEYRIKGKIRDEWQKDFQTNRDFLCKWSSMKCERSTLRQARRNAYTKRFHTGTGLMVEYDVNISRQHYLNGEIHIGNNVLLAKHVFIDYSGHVTIKDNVQLTNGVIIETHHHSFHSDWRESKKLIEQTSLLIEEGAVIGSRAIILPSCHYIGKHARVGAGAVVTHDIPDFAVAVGVPAKVIRTMDS